MVLDFVRLAQDHNIPTADSGHHHCSEGWVQTHCPFCAGGSDGWHLGFNLEQGNFNCWRCGGIPTHQVLRALLPEVSISALFLNYSRPSENHAVKCERGGASKITHPKGITTLTSAHIAYLRKRGFDPDQLVRDWGIKATGSEGGEWSWRVIIPICDKNGVEISYTGRAISDRRKPRYQTLELENSIANPKSVLYGAQYAKDRVIVVEGPTDVWRLGFGAVATLGSSWSDEQAALIRQYQTRYIMFDPERPAQKLAVRLAESVASAPGTTEIITGLKTDPGSMSRKVVLDLREQLGFDA